MIHCYQRKEKESRNCGRSATVIVESTIQNTPKKKKGCGWGGKGGSQPTRRLRKKEALKSAAQHLDLKGSSASRWGEKADLVTYVAESGVLGNIQQAHAQKKKGNP